MSAESNKISILLDRAKMLSLARSFFSKKNILEVDCPHITKNPSIDAYIDIMETKVFASKSGYLHTSPEYCMKRLLSIGMPDIYQLSHVYRKEEEGRFHNPEFTLVEWYRKDFSYLQMIEETVEFIHLFLPLLPHKKTSYHDLFFEYLSIDIGKATIEDLKEIVQKKGVNLSENCLKEDKDTLLSLLLTNCIEPYLGQDCLDVIVDYPPSQGALAQIALEKGRKVAKRFEIYHKSLELANGYLELTDPLEQRKRFLEGNRQRILQGKEPYAIDENFLSCLKNMKGIYCGVAVGFDRLMMLKHKAGSIREVLPFSWQDL